MKETKRVKLVRYRTVGLINKEYRGKFVEHTLSPYGNIFVDFLKKFQNLQ